ncbi:MAG: hypothetical protein IPP44_17055 [Ideonella sp.]|nr:hypothetical protein [Ideonella sp.]
MAPLRQAARLTSDNPRSAYVLALALDARGQRASAQALLESSAAKHPHEHNTLQALLVWCRASADLACVARHRKLLDQQNSPGRPRPCPAAEAPDRRGADD